jgi:hypothetical protein
MAKTFFSDPLPCALRAGEGWGGGNVNVAETIVTATFSLNHYSRGKFLPTKPAGSAPR